MVEITGSMLIDGRWVSAAESIDVRNPVDRRLVGTVPRGTPGDVAAAIGAAASALRIPFPAHERYEFLMRTAALVEDDAEAYATILAREGSKAIREARREPPRAANILRLAAEEGRRIAGESLPFDTRPGSENRVGYYFRVPVGVVAAIMPFNDPMAVAAHKIGPAIAAGNAIVVKPDSKTPLTILKMAQHFQEAGLPGGLLNVVTGHGSEIGDAIVEDPRVDLIAFTGGAATGERITRKAGVKRLLLELGSNSAVIVQADASLDDAVPAIASGAFAQAGQNCLGVQRVLVSEEIYDQFADRFVAHVRQLKAGVSTDEATDVCSLITEQQAKRVEAWIGEAVAGGARLRCGGNRQGALLDATVVENVPAGCHLDCDEVYGPVAALYRTTSLEEAVDKANATDYGLHAAIFTESLRDAFYAVQHLQVGAVIVNDSTDYRLDAMPFGGPKRSGIGREGISHAVMEMTETRVVCLNL